jgi:predicted nuclease of predicted toxin-antitoxin system
MRLLRFLRSLGHDVARVNELLSPTASDEAIVAAATREGRSILTQDLDFSAVVALSGRTVPSVISLRLSSSRVERVNAVLQEVLPDVEQARCRETRGNREVWRDTDLPRMVPR